MAEQTDPKLEEQRLECKLHLGRVEIDQLGNESRQCICADNAKRNGDQAGQQSQENEELPGNRRGLVDLAALEDVHHRQVNHQNQQEEGYAEPGRAREQAPGLEQQDRQHDTQGDAQQTTQHTNGERLAQHQRKNLTAGCLARCAVWG